MLTLTAEIINDPLKGFTGWFRGIRGVVAHGETREEVISELLRAYQIQLEMEDRKYQSKFSSDKTITTKDLNFELA